METNPGSILGSQKKDSFIYVANIYLVSVMIHTVSLQRRTLVYSFILQRKEEPFKEVARLCRV